MYYPLALCVVSYLAVLIILYLVDMSSLANSIMITAPLLLLCWLGIKTVIYLDVLLKGIQAIASVLSYFVTITQIITQNTRQEGQPIDWDAMLRQIREERGDD